MGAEKTKGRHELRKTEPRDKVLKKYCYPFIKHTVQNLQKKERIVNYNLIFFFNFRHYYKNKFMTRIDGVRLVYKFNWSKIPKEWRPFGV